MTDKERLEEIERNLDPLGYGMGGHLISVNDIYWFVGYAKEQHGRVQELEVKKDEFKKWWQDEAHYNNELIEQNKRYREALERIKDNVPLEFEHKSEYEAKKNVIRLMNIQKEVDEALESDLE